MPTQRSVFSPVLRSGLSALALLSTVAIGAPSAPNAIPAPAVAPASAAAPSAAKPATKAPVVNSNMDAQLFYQLLIAEIQANSQDPGSAYQLYLDSARRTKNGQLYQRAVEIALRARAGEQALSAAKAWRLDQPQSLPAAEVQTQILIAMGRMADLPAPLSSLLKLTPTARLDQAFANLPRSLSRLPNKAEAARIIDEVSAPWRTGKNQRASAWAASAESWLRADDRTKATNSLQQAANLDPALPVTALLAVELMKSSPQSEALVRTHLARPDASHAVRLAYARQLTLLQRYSEAESQLEQLVKDQPDQSGGWLLLAAIRLEMKKVAEAEAALQPVLKMAEPNTAKVEDKSTISPNPDVEQAYLLMAQAADQQNRHADALKWLEAADPQGQKLLTQSQRARVLASLGRLKEAQAAIRAVPETEPRDALLKAQAEAQVLREQRKWAEAHSVLSQAAERFPKDNELLYDLAMMSDRLKRHDEMERLLRTVIAQDPKNANALNALGYSFVERGIHSIEARELIERALKERPGDPFITDSLAWLEFKLGRPAQALPLLEQAWKARSDAEIAAHLAEVLWTLGHPERAREILREGLKQDRDNDTLQDTIKRLPIKP